MKRTFPVFIIFIFGLIFNLYGQGGIDIQRNHLRNFRFQELPFLLQQADLPAMAPGFNGFSFGYSLARKDWRFGLQVQRFEGTRVEFDDMELLHNQTFFNFSAERSFLLTDRFFVAPVVKLGFGNYTFHYRPAEQMSFKEVLENPASGTSISVNDVNKSLFSPGGPVLSFGMKTGYRVPFGYNNVALVGEYLYRTASEGGWRAAGNNFSENIRGHMLSLGVQYELNNTYLESGKDIIVRPYVAFSGQGVVYRAEVRSKGYELEGEFAYYVGMNFLLPLRDEGLHFSSTIEKGLSAVESSDGFTFNMHRFNLFAGVSQQMEIDDTFSLWAEINGGIGYSTFNVGKEIRPGFQEQLLSPETDNSYRQISPMLRPSLSFSVNPFSNKDIGFFLFTSANIPFLEHFVLPFYFQSGIGLQVGL